MLLNYVLQLLVKLRIQWNIASYLTVPKTYLKLKEDTGSDIRFKCSANLLDSDNLVCSANLLDSNNLVCSANQLES